MKKKEKIYLESEVIEEETFFQKTKKKIKK